MIVNIKRRKQIDEFIDNPHYDVATEYDELLDSVLLKDQVIKRLNALLNKDPYYFDTYYYLAQIYSEDGNFILARKILRKGYELAVKKIVNFRGEFPKRMEWLWLENRHLIRIINNWALFLWKEGKTEDALEIFRRLIRCNPNDNIGARYNILAIRMNIDPEFESDLISADPEFIDAEIIDEWFHKNATSYPDEFFWWFKWEKNCRD